jgi:hypothetical protein
MEDQPRELSDFTTPPKDSEEIWKKLILYCKKKRRLIECYYKAPSEEVEMILQTYHNKEKICRWLLSITDEPAHISTTPLKRPEVGPVGAPVYAYSILFECRHYYLALLEKENNSVSILFIKSLKLDDRYPLLPEVSL